jgi:hypothetical protein
MKLGLMQPYLFPHLPYFQLINAVDVFIIHDEVQYVKTWINRNKILVNGQARYIILPVKKKFIASSIYQQVFAPPVLKYRKRVLRQIEGAYRGAPYFNEVFEMLKSICGSTETNLTHFLADHLIKLCTYIGIKNTFFLSSQLSNNNGLKGQDRVIEINRIMGSNHYINSIGGKKLYSQDAFNHAGIKLSFLETNDINYTQFQNQFVPSLAIIDILMFNDTKTLKKMIGAYRLVS